MDSEKKDFVIENGVLKKYNGKNPIVEIPSGVSQIAIGAFAYSPAKQVVIPEGVTELENPHYIDRGYEDLVQALALLGANLRRIE